MEKVEKKRCGRPATGLTRKNQLLVKMTDAEIAGLKEIADRENRTIRQVIINALSLYGWRPNAPPKEDPRQMQLIPKEPHE